MLSIYGSGSFIRQTKIVTAFKDIIYSWILLQIWQSTSEYSGDLDLDLENIPPSLRERLVRLSRENKQLKAKVSHS
jgi:hypothetical protein